MRVVSSLPFLHDRARRPGDPQDHRQRIGLAGDAGRGIDADDDARRSVAVRRQIFGTVLHLDRRRAADDPTEVRSCWRLRSRAHLCRRTMSSPAARAAQPRFPAWLRDRATTASRTVPTSPVRHSCRRARKPVRAWSPAGSARRGSPLRAARHSRPRARRWCARRRSASPGFRPRAHRAWLAARSGWYGRPRAPSAGAPARRADCRRSRRTRFWLRSRLTMPSVSILCGASGLAMPPSGEPPSTNQAPSSATVPPPPSRIIF